MGSSSLAPVVLTPAMDRNIFVLLFSYFSMCFSGPFFPNLPNIGSSGLVDISHLNLQFNPSKQNTDNHQRQAPPGSKMCLTPGCVSAAADLINQMDQTADPCSNFYQFACGGFVAEAVIPDHQTSKGAFCAPHQKDAALPWMFPGLVPASLLDNTLSRKGKKEG